MIRLTALVALLVVVPLGLADHAAGQDVQRVRRAPPQVILTQPVILARPPAAVAELNVAPQQAGDIEQGGGEGQPQRFETCVTTCTIVAGEKIYNKECQPFIDSAGAQVADATAPADRPSAIAARVAERPAVAPTERHARFPARRATDPAKAEAMASDTAPGGAAVRRASPVFSAAAVEYLSGDRIRLIATAQQCKGPPSTYSLVVQRYSPYCWIDHTTYCRYNPAGKTGYPCNCGSKSGYFG